MIGVLDADGAVYSCGFVGEERSILAVEKKTGNEYKFKNRTSLWGRKKNVIEGWLAEHNKTLKEPLTRDDFEIFDVQEPKPVSHVLQTVKTYVDNLKHSTKADKMILYHGVGDSFRVEASTILKYKSGRFDAIRPIHKDEIIQYLERKYGSIPCIGLEADDWCTIIGSKKDHFVISSDKDARGTHCLVYNPKTPEKGIQDCRGLGSLWIEEKVSATTGQKYREVKGIGRKFFYHQWNWADPVDTYFANSASELEWGEMSSYNSLKDCKTDAECLKVITETYKYLYPCSRKIKGWRDGSVLEVDWRYVASENFIMSRMLRTPDEKLTAQDVLEKFGLWSA